MWFEQPIGKKINDIRTDDVLKTTAKTVTTSCPYCLQMLEEGIVHKEMQEMLKAKDIVELLEQAIEQPS
jgi:Fe-S oxidoreductase